MFRWCKCLVNNSGLLMFNIGKLNVCMVNLKYFYPQAKTYCVKILLPFFQQGEAVLTVSE